MSVTETKVQSPDSSMCNDRGQNAAPSEEAIHREREGERDQSREFMVIITVYGFTVLALSGDDSLGAVPPPVFAAAG